MWRYQPIITLRLFASELKQRPGVDPITRFILWISDESSTSSYLIRAIILLLIIDALELSIISSNIAGPFQIDPYINIMLEPTTLTEANFYILIGKTKFRRPEQRFCALLFASTFCLNRENSFALTVSGRNHGKVIEGVLPSSHSSTPGQQAVQLSHGEVA